MRIDILTLFPGMFRGPFEESIVKRALDAGLVGAVVRDLPGVLGSAQAAEEGSFAEGLLEAPPCARPPEYRGWAVPEVLLSGNHREVARWRRRQDLLLTARRRPELLTHVTL